uniref:Cationic amino acid transporter 4-like n=1 Tax=Saccoglossus kowalevskii TaxID=10224 RepID=A0ABM0LUX8_SACKO|nr:PREDICTED: cationic amino acid transporter 4-like [Saccoglossus kowalevskii]
MAFFSSVLKRLSRLKSLESDNLDTPMKRCLSSFDLTMIGIGSMMGSGLYVLTGTVAKNTAGPAVIVSFVIAGFVTLLAALCYAEFGARIPITGSAYTYTYVSMGEFWAFLIGWNIVLEYIISAAAVARAWSGYFDEMLDHRIRNFTYEYITGGPWNYPLLAQYPDLFALLLIILGVIITALGANLTSKINSFLTILNICTVILVIGAGLNFVNVNNWKIEGGFTPFGISGIMSGAATCFFAYVGFDFITASAEEAKNPAKSIPIAICTSLAVVAAAYIAASTVVTLMVPYYDIVPEAAFVDTFRHVGVKWLVYAVGVGSLIGMTATFLTAMFVLPRIVFAMARDGLLFAVLAKVNSHTHVPVVATVTLAYTIVAAGVLVLRYEPAEALTIVYKHKNKDTIEMNLKRKDETSPLNSVDSHLHGGEVRESFNGCRTLRNATPGTIPAFAVFIMSIFMFTLAAVIVFCGDALAEARFWVIVIVVIFGSVVLLCFFVLCIHYQNTSIVTFKMPLVPLIPSLSIFCNAMLMMNLSYMTWVRFAVWITLGMMLYFCYGIRHSKLAMTLEEENNDLNRYYIMPTESPCITSSSVDLWQPQSVTTPNNYGSVSEDEEESNVKNKMKKL